MHSCLIYIGLLDSTGDVERAFAAVQMRDLKKRERHLGHCGMADELMVSLEVPREVDALVIRPPTPLTHHAAHTAAPRTMHFMWRPKEFILQVRVVSLGLCGIFVPVFPPLFGWDDAQVQKKYAEFFSGSVP